MTTHMPQEAVGIGLEATNSASGSPDTHQSPTRPQITHSCGAAWSSRRAAHCAACHLTFSSDSAFDSHRRADGCLDPATATRADGTKKFQPRADRSGATLWGLPGTWRGPDSEEDA